MKHEFTKAVQRLAQEDKRVLFLTGDLGYNMLEDCKECLGDRFINAGVAEQNMVSVAAGMAYSGFKPWVYSIAPFVTLKVIEQIRNDVCHMNLPVSIVGNGGGYGYGIMGSTHHLLEDIAIISTFPNITVYSPAFSEDIEIIVNKMYKSQKPGYMRLNFAKEHHLKLPEYSGLRNLISGTKVTVVVLGHLVHNVLEALDLLQLKSKVDLWVVTEVPFKMDNDLLVSLNKTKNVVLIEEHTNTGGVGEKVLVNAALNGIKLNKVTHLYGKGYPSKLYGSQKFHWTENKLDSQSIAQILKTLV